MTEEERRIEESGASTQAAAQGEDVSPPRTSPELPEGVALEATPSGIEVAFHPDGHRYWVRFTNIEGPAFDLDWIQVPSITQTLDFIEKGGLPWWGMKVGVSGAMEFSRRVGAPETADHVVVDWLNENKLTTNHVRDKAGHRGSSVHRALEKWAETGHPPNPGAYHSSESGYVAGLRSFLSNAKPRPIRVEQMVASTDRFAGRYDLLCEIDDGRGIVRRIFPKNPDLITVTEGGYYLIDLKTSAGVYDTHHLQLAAYEIANKECGFEPIDKTAVLRVSSDGRYELVPGVASGEDYLDALAFHRTLYGVRERMKKKP